MKQIFLPILVLITFLLLGCQPSIDELFQAITEKDPIRVERLIKRGVSISAEDAKRQPLEIAIRTRQLDIVSMLIENGADIYKPFENNQRPYEWIIDNRAYDMLLPLFAGGLDYTIKYEGDLVVFELFRWGREDIVLELIEMGLSPNLTDDFFHRSVFTYFIESQKITLEQVNVLIENGADPLLEDDRGFSPIEVALSNGNIEIIDFILRSGLTIDSIDKPWSVLVQYWNENDLEKVARLLLESGASINLETDFPLHTAVRNIGIDALKWFLSNGADPNRCDNNGFLPEYYTRFYPRFGDTAESELWMERYITVNEEIQKYR
jgi:ankyrin repeat protein